MTQPRFDQVKAAAKGRWKTEILPAFGIDARYLDGKHHPCPGCGGIDRFRFSDWRGTGSFICSGGEGGVYKGDGFNLLDHVLGFDAKTALIAVAKLLGVEGQRLTKDQWRLINAKRRERDLYSAEVELLHLATQWLFEVQKRAHAKFVRSIPDERVDEKDSGLIKEMLDPEDLRSSMETPIEAQDREIRLARAVFSRMRLIYGEKR